MARALVVTTAGINCEAELAEAFAMAGASPQLVHLNRLMRQPALVEAFDLIGLPGGFSYGDAVAAGRVAAQLMRETLYGSFVRAIERGVPIIAPCNGFQMAVQIGLLPGPAVGEPWPDAPPSPSVSLARNASARFIDRWVRIEIPGKTRCVWTQGLEMSSETSLLPIAHGEGRFIATSDEVLQQLESDGRIAVRYAVDDNPNGSQGDVAGICDASGLVLGLMPHPERYTRWMHHPWWTRLDEEVMKGDPPGLMMFRNAMKQAEVVRL